MATQSPQRTRKPLQPQVQAVQHQLSGPAQIRREHSNSPGLRERQRYVRTQSMPIVSNAGIDAPDSPSQQQLQQSPLQTQSQLNHAASQTLPNAAAGPQPGPGGTQQPQFGYPRPIPLTRPGFLAHSQTEKWAMTEDFQADIDRADLIQQQQQQHQQTLQHQQSAKQSPPQSAPAPGTAGVAYAGGAASAGFISHLKSLSGGPLNISPDMNGVAEVQQQQQQTVQTVQTVATAVPSRRRASNEQAAHRASPLSYALRKTANTSPGYPSMPSPRSMKNRTPDRSLPVQEEPDDHEHEHMPLPPSPAPSSDVNPPKEMGKVEHDAEGTLVDLLGDDDDDGGHSSSQRRHAGESTSGSGEGSGTPRSNAVFKSHPNPQGIQQVLQKPVSGVNGAQSFNTNDFQQTLKKIQGDGGPSVITNGIQQHPIAQVQPQHFATLPVIPPFSRAEYSRNESRGSYPNWMLDYYHNYPEDVEYLDENAAAYLQQFMPPGSAAGSMAHSLHSRPDAPIPPTPHSQTSAPTPFQRNAIAHFHHLQQQHEAATHENGAGQNGQQRPFIPPHTPATPSGTPYPYPFSHVRRGLHYPPPSIPRVPSSVYDPAAVQEQLLLQMQMYALNNQNAAANASGTGSLQNGSGAANTQNNVYLNHLYNQGMETDSTLSPASTPFPGMGPSYHPFNAFLNQTRAFARARQAGGIYVPGAHPGEEGRITAASHRSSPSHQPVPMPPMPPMTNGVGHGAVNGSRGRGVAKSRNEGMGTLRGKKGATRKSRLRNEMSRSRGRDAEPPSRVASTQPRDTSPEESSGEETAGEGMYAEKQDGAGNGQRSSSRASRIDAGKEDDDSEEEVMQVLDEDNDEGEWVDEEVDEQELLDLDYHPTYVMNSEKRRKRWDQRWDELVRAFQALDRETDSTLVLFAAQANSTNLHALTSRAIRRDSALGRSASLLKAKSAFAQLASQRRRSKTPQLSLLERFYAASTSASSAGSSDEGGGGGSGAEMRSAVEREKDLQSMLRAALGSLGELRRMYEVREARWREEERRMGEERVGMEMLMRQAFGEAGTATGMASLGFTPQMGYDYGFSFP